MVEVFLFVFFLFGFYSPFKNISHIKPIVHQRWAKTGEPWKKKKHLTIHKQNLAFPRDPNNSNHSGEKPNVVEVYTMLMG